MVKAICETQDGKRVIRGVEKAILRVSAYGVLFSGNSVLVTKTYLPLWEFPGGAVEKGETLFQALQREFKEETGIEVNIKRFIAERECFYLSPTGKIFHSFQNFFLVSLKKIGKSKILSLNNSHTKWIAKNVLSSKNMKVSAFDVFFLLMTKKKRGEGNFVTLLQKTRCLV